MDAIKLHILSPEGTLLDADVALVTLPGSAGQFTVLHNHAPLVTSLEKGDIRYIEYGGAEHRISILDGFAKVGDNIVTVCAEV